MSEINPNHPVTQELHDHWHKIVALMMIKFGVKEFMITDLMIRDCPQDIAVVFDARSGGIGFPVVRLVSMSEAIALAKKEGGLPV